MHPANMPQEDEYISISQAALYLGISEDTLRRWDRSGKFIPSRTIGNVRRYSLDDLNKLKNNYRQISAQEALVQIKQDLKEVKNILKNSKNNYIEDLSSNLNNKVPVDNIATLTLNQEIEPVKLKEHKHNKIKYIIRIFNSITYNIKHKLKEYGVMGYAILVIIIILMLFLTFAFKDLTYKLNTIHEFINTTQQYNQELDEQVLEPSVLKGNSIIIGDDRLTVDDLGNLFLTGKVTGGYLDTNSHNIITNSSFEQNSSGKALYYIYEENAEEKNVYVSQDTSANGLNSLKFSLSKDEKYRLRPSYPSLNSGLTYNFSMLVKPLGIKNGYIKLGYGDDVKNYEINKDSEWQIISFTKQIGINENPDNNSFFIEASSADGGSIYVDSLQLETGSITTSYKPSTLDTDGVITLQDDNIFPLISNTVSLGTITKPFNEIYVNKQTVNDDLSVMGDAKIEGDLTVAGDIEFNAITAVDKITIQNDGLYTGTGIGTKRLDSAGNLLNIASIGLNFGTLNSTTDYLISSVGLAVGNGSIYYFNKNGNIKTASLNSIGDIKLGDPNGETDSLGIYFTGVSGHTNEAGFRFNTSSGKLEYRDENTSSWTTLDSLSSSGNSGDYSAGNGLYLDDTEFQLGGALSADTTITLGAYDLNFNLTNTGDLDFQDNGTSLLFISDNGNIGIGTNNPTAKLDVSSYANFGSSVNIASTLNTSALKISGGAHDGYVLTSDASGNAIWEIVNPGITYVAGNGLTLDSSTFTLGGTLTESTAINQDSFGFTLENPGTADTIINLGSTGDLLIQDTGTTFATFANNGSFTLDNIILDNNLLSATGDLGLGLYDNEANGIFIQDGGRVGLGTTNPAQILDVVGGIKAAAYYLYKNDLVYGSVTANETGTIINSNSDVDIIFAPNGVEKARINIDGNLGIGTTNPYSKLEVNGGDIRVNGGSFIDDGTTLDVPDYVFEENYKLMNLDDLSQYIAINKHLPNIPDQNDQAGWAALSLQDRDMKLLEKIEENVLYQLDLKSKVDNLNLVLDNKTSLTDSGILSNTGDLFIQAEVYDGLLENLDVNILESLVVMITDSLGETKVAVGAFGKIFSASLITGYANIKNVLADTILTRRIKVEEKLLSPIVEADQILTDQLAAQNAVTQQLTAQDATISGKLTIGDVSLLKGEAEAAATAEGFDPVLNVLGDASISGTLKTEDASVSGQLIADSARIKTLIAEKIKAGSIEGLEAKIDSMLAASISAQMLTIKQNPGDLTMKQPNNETISQSPSLPANWEASLNSLASRLENMETATASGAWTSSTNLAYDSQIMVGSLDTDLAMVNTFLGVLGTASIVNAEITNSLTVQDSLSLNQNSISTLSDTLYLQPNGLGKVDILAGAVTIESNGNLTVNGDLYLKGSLYSYSIHSDTLETKTATVSGSLFANLINTKGKDITIELSPNNGTLEHWNSASQSAKLAIKNNGQEVAFIDASGSARFKAINTSKLYLPYTYNTIDNSIDASVTANELNQSADSIGMGTIKAGETELLVQAPAVSKDSLIFLTPTTTTLTPLAVSSKEITKGFTVSIALPENENVSFNWWIIN